MKTLHNIILLFSCFVILNGISVGQITLPHYDGFNYGDGTYLGGQGNWVNNNSGDEVTISSGSLTYTGYPASYGNKVKYDGAGYDPSKTFTQTSTGKVYYSYLLNISSVGSLNATGGYISGLYQTSSSTTTGAAIWVRLDGSGYDIGISPRSSAPASWSTAKSVNTTYLIVVCYEFVSGTVNDIAKVWINPDAASFGGSEPAATISVTNGTTDLNGAGRFFLRQDGSTTTPFVEIDELRLGTTWASVTSAFSFTNFYSKSSGSLELTSTWGTNTDGSGTNPVDFTTAGQVFNIRNQASPSITANWVVSGSNSSIVLGDGTNACSFTIGSSNSVTGFMEVSTNTSLTLQNTTVPNFGTCNAASTVDYAGSSTQNIVPGNYGNLIISNSSGVTAPTGYSISGNFTNNGVYTHNSGTVIFNGSSALQTISGSSSTAFNAIVVNKGSSQSNLLEVQSTITMAGTLTLTNGTFKLSSVSTLAPFAANPNIPVNAGLWINNSSATINQGASNFNWTVNGLLRVTNGTMNLGNIADMTLTSGPASSIIIEGGAVNVSGRLTKSGSSGSYAQSGGVFTVVTVGSTATGGFYFGDAGSNFTMSDGTIVLQNVTGAASDFYIIAGGTTNVTGGTLQIGNAGTPSNQVFRIRATAPLYNLVVDATTNTKTAQFVSSDPTVMNNITIQTGSTLDLNNLVATFSGSLFTNNGSLIGSLLSASSSRFNFSGASVAQTYQGTGTVGTSAADPLAGISFSNDNGVILSMESSNLLVNRINLLRGPVINSNKLTLGNSGTGASFINVGTTGTAATAAGSFDAAPDFQLGTGGLDLSYVNATNVSTSGFEITVSRTVKNLTINNTGGGATLTGGNLTIDGVLNLMSGNLLTGSNKLSLTSTASVARTSGHIIGNLEKNISTGALVSQAFEVGSALGYSPVTVDFTDVTTGDFVTAKVTEGTHPQTATPANTLQRYWTITPGGSLAYTDYSATFTYLTDDFNTGVVEATDENSLVIGKYATGWELPTIGTRTPGNADDGGSIQAVGLTAFSDFIIGKENQALPVELTAFNSSYSNNKITLVWTTATEVNNSGFYVERSITAQPDLPVSTKPEWETLGFVNGAGNSNTNRTYKFLDNNLHGNGIYAYRLKQVDNDGKFQYAGKTEVEVKIIPKEYGLLQNFPNPFNPSTTISYMLPRRSNVKLELYSSIGQLITVLFDGSQDAGYQTYKLNTEKFSLSSGIYIYKLTAVDEQNQIHSVGVRKLTLVK